jgi:hypothetical protein
MAFNRQWHNTRSVAVRQRDRSLLASKTMPSARHSHFGSTLSGVIDFNGQMTGFYFSGGPV